MAAWIRRGNENFHWDLYRRFGRPPVVVPPRWALYERIWEANGVPFAATAPSDSSGGSESTGREADGAVPGDWAETLRSSLSGASVCLVVPDATRVGAWRHLLPGVLVALADRFRSRTLLVATGTHQPVSAAALAAHLGRESGDDDGGTDPFAGWRTVQNSDEGFRTHRTVGRTSDGTEIRIHPDYLDADVRVLLGDVSYHYFAGFGGGPKLVFPGCGEPGAAARNHRRALVPAGRSVGSGGSSGPGGAIDSGRDPGRAADPGDSDRAVDSRSEEWDPRCAPGATEDNPVLAEIEEAAALAPADWSIAPTFEPPPVSELDPSTRARFPLRVVQGPDLETRRISREIHDHHHRIEFTQRPDLLIADAGGFPRDGSFLQAQKSLQHAMRFVDPGGRILWIARCELGTASPMIDRYVRDPQLFVPDPGDLHVQTLAALRRVTRSYEVALWSDLPETTVRALGLEPIRDESAALEWTERIPGARWGWLPRSERFLPASGWLGGRR